MSTVAELFNPRQLATVNQDSPTPLYFRLYSMLKEAILGGTIEDGEQLPTEQQLGDHFGISRITAKRAMDELAAEGLVQRRRGKGTHVTYQYTPKPMPAPLIGMLEEIECMARHTDVSVLECKRLKPPVRVREELKLDQDAKALRLVRVRSRNGEPFGYYASWTRGISKPVAKRDFERASRLEVFRRQGLLITHVTQTISAIAATAELAQLLQTSEDAPLLSLVRRSFETHNGEERLADYLTLYYHPDRFQYQMDLKMD